MGIAPYAPILSDPMQQPIILRTSNDDRTRTAQTVRTRPMLARSNPPIHPKRIIHPQQHTPLQTTSKNTTLIHMKTVIHKIVFFATRKR